jgi:hypothetical protein
VRLPKPVRRESCLALAAAVAIASGCTAGDQPGSGAAPAALAEPASGPAGGTGGAADGGDHSGAAGPFAAAEDLDELIARRYEAYWDGFDTARREPTTDPATDFPALMDLAAGEQLDVSYQALIELAEAGEAIREPETPAIGGVDPDAEHRVRIVRVDGTVAEVSGCLVNDDVRYASDTDAVVRDSVSTVLSSSTMALTGGEWKLIRSRAVEISDGVSGCWLTDDAEFPY